MLSLAYSSVGVIHYPIEGLDIPHVGSFKSSQPGLSCSEKVRDSLGTNFESVVTKSRPYSVCDEYPDLRKHEAWKVTEHLYRTGVALALTVPCTVQSRLLVRKDAVKYKRVS